MMQTLIALDQALNTLVWAKGEGFGMADETLSARMWRLRERPAWGSAVVIVDAVAAVLGDPEHCYTSWLGEFERHQLPESYRQHCEHLAS